MKVLHVIPSLSVVHGGPTQALMLMEQALARQGVSVETATTDDDGPGRRLARPLGQPTRESGIVRWYFPKLMEFYKPSPALARWIAAEVSRYDLVHIHALFSFTSTVAARAAVKAGVPYIVRPLGTLGTYGMTQRRRLAKAISFKLIESSILRNAAAVHFTSESEEAQARLLGVDFRSVVVPLATDLGASAGALLHERGAPSPHAMRVLYLSRLDAKKNLEGLLQALHLLRNEMPRVELAVAGTGEAGYVSSLHQRALDLGVADRIRWLGHVEGRDKALAFANADIFALPSFSENFGIAAAEALALGLPCLLGDGVAIAGEVEAASAGVRVEPTPEAIAAGLRTMMTGSVSLAAMSSNARRLAQERFSPESMGSRLKMLYTEILAR